ncbi:hypothetical protein KIW84_076864 [Lathyrus oleraceus]|uniref:Uncharacterized protein n=1 Tax=Pisum sativum TaxID=3888 RepID=A0A9D4VXM4_PEA|nr:hypothetical protein KIW84_076864 [Pisum sativum]
MQQSIDSQPNSSRPLSYKNLIQEVSNLSSDYYPTLNVKLCPASMQVQALATYYRTNRQALTVVEIKCLRERARMNDYRFTNILVGNSVEKDNDMLIVLLLLSKYWLQNVPAIEPGKLNTADFITRSSVAQGLEGCREREQNLLQLLYRLVQQRLILGCSFATLLAVLGGQPKPRAYTPMDKEGSLQNPSRRSIRSSWLLARRGLKLHQVELCIELGLV